MVTTTSDVVSPAGFPHLSLLIRTTISVRVLITVTAFTISVHVQLLRVNIELLHQLVAVTFDNLAKDTDLGVAPVHFVIIALVRDFLVEAALEACNVVADLIEAIALFQDEALFVPLLL